MGEARYTFRVRGRSSAAVLTALQEGLDVDVAPTSTAMRGWLPDQAALFGMLARIGLPGTAPDRSSQRSAWTAASLVMVMAKPPRPDRCPDQAAAGTRQPPGRAIGG
jgi:hypothetical protein